MDSRKTALFKDLLSASVTLVANLNHVGDSPARAYERINLAFAGMLARFMEEAQLRDCEVKSTLECGLGQSTPTHTALGCPG
jgi:hypothetical protein